MPACCTTAGGYCLGAPPAVVALFARPRLAVPRHWPLVASHMKVVYMLPLFFVLLVSLHIVSNCYLALELVLLLQVERKCLVSQGNGAPTVEVLEALSVVGVLELWFGRRAAGLGVRRAATATGHASRDHG